MPTQQNKGIYNNWLCNRQYSRTSIIQTLIIQIKIKICSHILFKKFYSIEKCSQKRGFSVFKQQKQRTDML